MWSSSSWQRGVWFGVTADPWSSSGADGEAFMSFTVHYLNTDWQLRSHCLETQPLPDDHRAEQICERTEAVLSDWKMQKERLSGITTGQASSTRKAFEDFPCVWFSCFGRNLNLAVSKVLKMAEVESATRACRRAVQARA